MALDDMNEGFLQVTNHKEHPTNKAYKVFFFYSEEESSFFETQLNDFIDKNSAHVGTFFIGSSSKVNNPPYEIDMIYKIQIIVVAADLESRRIDLKLV